MVKVIEVNGYKVLISETHGYCSWVTYRSGISVATIECLYAYSINEALQNGLKSIVGKRPKVTKVLPCSIAYIDQVNRVLGTKFPPTQRVYSVGTQVMTRAKSPASPWGMNNNLEEEKEVELPNDRNNPNASEPDDTL